MRHVFQYIVGLLVTLALAEFVELAPWISERLLAWATRWLPSEERQRYQDDWLGELDSIPGKMTKLIFTFNVLIKVPATQRVLTGRDALWALAVKRALALGMAGLLAALMAVDRYAKQLRNPPRTEPMLMWYAQQIEQRVERRRLARRMKRAEWNESDEALVPLTEQQASLGATEDDALIHLARQSRPQWTGDGDDILPPPSHIEVDVREWVLPRDRSNENLRLP